MSLANSLKYVFIGLNFIGYLGSMEPNTALKPNTAFNEESFHSIKAVRQRQRNKIIPALQENNINYFNNQNFYRLSSDDFGWNCLCLLGNTVFIGAMVSLHYLHLNV
jgi:hypothetical protein